MIFLILLLASFSVYAVSIKGHFVADDFQIILNPNLQAKRFGWGFYSDRHMGWWSFVIDWFFSDVEKLRKQGRPWVFHVQNILWHTSTAWLVSLILTLFHVNPLLALLFVVHPLCVGSVAYITGRFSLVSAFFGTLAVLGVLKGSVPLFLLGWLLACMSKPDMLVLPVLAASLGGPQWLLCYICALPMLANGRGWVDTREMARTRYDKRNVKNGADRSLERWSHFITYLTETAIRFPQWLIGLNLKVMPDVPTRPRWVSRLAILLLSLSMIFLMLLKMSLFKVGLTLMLVSPWIFYSLIPLPHLIFEYRAYMNAVGMALLLACLPVPLVCCVGGMHLYLTVKRSRYWNNMMGLWGTAWNEGSRSAFVTIQLGTAFLMHGRLNDAEQFLIEGLRLQPSNKGALHGLQQLAILKMDCLAKQKEVTSV